MTRVDGGERWEHTATGAVWWVSRSTRPDATLKAENEKGDTMQFTDESDLLRSAYWVPVYAPSVGVGR